MFSDWNRQWPPNNSQWRHPGIPGRPHAPFRGQYQRFNQPRTHFPPRSQFQPGNDNYWCETCDRGFATEDLLNKHMQQHQKCNIDGCQFIAHPKVITKHIQMQHSSGLYKKIANLHKPEEIEKWRAERRKKYPTKANIDKKAAELKEKIDRGEKMGLDRKRNYQNKDNLEYNRDNKYQPGFDSKRRNSMGNENQPRSKFNRNNITNNSHNRKRPPRAKPKALPPVEDGRKLKPFTGISDIQMDSDNEVEEVSEVNELIEIDDDLEYKSVHLKAVDTTEPIVCGALSSLMCDYGSSDDEEDIEKNTSSDKKVLSVQGINTKDVIKKSSKTIQQDNIKTVIEQPSKIIQEETIYFKSVQNSTNSKDVPEKMNNVDVHQVNAYFKDKAEKSLVCEDSQINSSVLSRYNKTTQNTDSAEIKHEPAIKEDTTCIQPIDEDESGPEEIRVIKNEDTTLTSSEEPKPKNAVARKKNLIQKKQPYRQPKLKLPSTLLQKLLFKEMKQERNIVLQCIRHIRRNNYFDKKE